MTSARAQFKNFIEKTRLEAELTEALDKDLGLISLEMESEIKERTPVVTSDLKSSFVGRRTNFLEHEVATNIEYAPFVEYGSEGFNVSFFPRAMMRRGAAAVEKQGLKYFINSKQAASKIK